MNNFQENPIKTKVVVPVGINAERIDIFLSKYFEKFSRSFFAKLIDNKKIKVNQKIVAKGGFIIKSGDILEIEFPEARDVIIAHQIDKSLGIKIIYEHEHFLIVFKPAGMIIHPASSFSKEMTLSDWLVDKFKELKGVGFSNRPSIVHRLDKDTSGLVIVARTNYAHAIFTKLFKDRLIEKYYLAIVNGIVIKDGFVDSAIQRDNFIKTKMVCHPFIGRPSKTFYEVLETFGSYTFLLIKPVTGRTHQIRVHLKSIGFPIIGDAVYYKKSEIIKRQALHAYKLSFEFDNKSFVFWHNLPLDMQQALANLKLV